MKYVSMLFLASLAILFSCGPLNSKDSTDAEESAVPRLQIAYNVLVDANADDYDVFIMNPEGSEKANIVNNSDVAWTYLGGSGDLFFISDRDTCRRCFFLYRMDPDGSHVRKVSNFRLRDSWMSTRKNETEIIVNPHPDVDSAFYILDMQGNLLQRVVHNLPYGNDPCFSPDGNQVVFRGAQKKSKREEGFTDELYLMDVNGSGLKQLTWYPASDTTAPWYAYKSGPPRWNQKLNFITYQSFQNGKYSLFAVSPSGTEQWKLTSIEKNEGYHDWSPDGDWLAIEVFDAEQSQFHIALMNWETKDFKTITDTSFQYQQAPVFIDFTE